MRLPCEIIIIDILPVIRKELAVKLVHSHGLNKANVARMFGVSGTAVSQYIHGTRGGDAKIRDSPLYSDFINEIAVSAKNIVSNGSTVDAELCRICEYVKRTGLHEYADGRAGADLPPVKCAECPKQDIY